MKIAVLNSGKLHHKYLTYEISKKFPISGIIIENTDIVPPFPTYHLYEDLQKSYEFSILSENKMPNFEDISETIFCDNINDAKTYSFLSDLKPDIVITFGTRKIGKKIIDVCPNGFINLHGGNPERYRGLDSHLWSIYHNDFENIVVTLHRLNAKLDDGEIISKREISLNSKLHLHQLRIENVRVCSKLLLDALSYFKNNRKFLSYPQKNKGRYYSFMPDILKEKCVKNFENHIRGL